MIGEHIAEQDGSYGASPRPKPDLKRKKGLAHAYVFGALQEARDAFTAKTGLAIEWDEAPEPPQADSESGP